uniref:Uncharacterized protein n=1 Tax=Anguilla anguilla TaxID=7936 RepID=A0A0E9RW43_ANGAN
MTTLSFSFPILCRNLIFFTLVLLSLSLTSAGRYGTSCQSAVGFGHQYHPLHLSQ